MQEAVDRIGEMLNNCYRRWYSALQKMEIWGEHIDKQVLAFIDACRNVALGNLHWRWAETNSSQIWKIQSEIADRVTNSFKTGRYLGAEGDQVHETRMLHLPN